MSEVSRKVARKSAPRNLWNSSSQPGKLPLHTSQVDDLGLIAEAERWSSKKFARAFAHIVARHRPESESDSAMSEDDDASTEETEPVQSFQKLSLGP